MEINRSRTEAIVDPSIIDRMIADRDADTVAGCIRVFVEEMEGRVSRIATASSATYGALRLAVVSRAIEEACDRGDLAKVPGMTAGLPGLASETAAALGAWCIEYPPHRAESAS